MANTIIHKKSSTTTATPTTVQLSLGEIAINTADGKIFIKKDDGAESIVEIGAAPVDSVNTQTGVVVLDADDISDTATTNKFVTAADITKIGIALTEGKQTLWIPASSMTPSVTTGAATGSTETTTNKVNYDTLDFDATADEYAWFSVAFPKAWNNGTITYSAYWTSTVVTGTCEWNLGGVALANDNPMDTALGTDVEVSDTAIGTAGDLLISPESGALTIAGTPVSGEMCMFRVKRDAVTDTMAGDASLIGIKLFFTTNAADDT